MSYDFPLRINSYLAKAGLGSRRYCENLVKESKVKINGEIVTNLAYKVERDDKVFVDGKLVKPIETLSYFALNKPINYICSNFDPHEKLYARDLIKIDDNKHLFHVGRLDKDSCGLIIYTNDGNFANLVMHPSNEIEKEYIVTVDTKVRSKELQMALKGLALEEGQSLYKIKSFKIIDDKITSVVLTEGKNREVRKIFGHLGYRVVSLKRTRIGNIELGNLKEGHFRSITNSEIDKLLGGIR